MTIFYMATSFGPECGPSYMSKKIKKKSTERLEISSLYLKNALCSCNPHFVLVFYVLYDGPHSGPNLVTKENTVFPSP
jgi:hypothetical protein